MGYSLSWAALKGGNVKSVCAVLGLRPTGKREEVAEAKIDGVQLPSGWYVVLFDHDEVKDSLLEKLSRNGEVVSCFVEDHVMFSSASGWIEGKEIWKVWHDGGELGHTHLETRGKLPPEFEDMRKVLFEKQVAADRDNEPVDYVYDLTAELAKRLVGFRHDEDIPGLSGDVFEVLERESALGRFFGGPGRRNTSVA
jgi:hypothetical protein